MSNFCIVILAAGEGKRMQSNVPKVLHEICAKPMLGYVVDAAKALKPKKIIVVLGKKRPEIREALSKDICVVYQEQPLGTADAVRAAKKAIPSGAKDVVVLYGDTPLVTDGTIRALYDFHVSREVSSTVLTTFLNNPRGYGRVLRNEAGQFIGIVEDKDASFAQKAIREINTGMYCFNKEELLEGLEHVRQNNQSGEFYLTDVVGWLFNKNKKIDACVTDNAFEVLGVNSQAELREASLIIRGRILDKHSCAGVSIQDYATTFIDPTAKIGRGTKIFPFTFIERNSVVGDDCFLGPFCHLREGAVLKNKVSIGNFTEIKNSVLDEGVMMRHFSYLGDTKVGRKVNIGAGTVVANFDGKKKNKTVIKDRAFIGSGSVLVAPVTIGKNAVVGAGSVVTHGHNVADGSIVVGVPARDIKKLKAERLNKNK